MNFQNTADRGFLAGLPSGSGRNYSGCGRQPGLDRFDVNFGAMAVELFVLTDLVKARKVADFLIRHIEGQLDPKRFYHGRVVKPSNYVTDLDAKNPSYCSIEMAK